MTCLFFLWTLEVDPSIPCSFRVALTTEQKGLGQGGRGPFHKDSERGLQT